MAGTEAGVGEARVMAAEEEEEEEVVDSLLGMVAYLVAPPRVLTAPEVHLTVVPLMVVALPELTEVLVVVVAPLGELEGVRREEGPQGVRVWGMMTRRLC